MDTNNTKQAFANICERIWKQILSEEALEPEIEASMRRVVAQLVMVAWNTCITSESLSEAKDKVVAFAKKVYPENENAANPLLNAVSIKWHDFFDDKTLIASTAVEIIDGQPKAIAYLKGELPAANEATSAFRRFMESPEVQERLKNVPPEKLNEAIGELVNEYNASLPPVDEEEPKAPNELFEFPLKREFLEETFQLGLWEIPLENKTNMMKNIVKEHSFLAPLCKDYEEHFKSTERVREKGEDSSYPGSVPELILAIMGAYAHTVDFSEIDEELLAECRDTSKEIVDSFLNQDEFFYETTTVFEESDLMEFICEHVAALNLPKNELRKTLKALLAFGGAISAVREANYPGNYEEEYDFDEENLMALRLKVDLLGEDMSAVMLVREDMTFDELSNYINFMFEREEGHLYRFDCDDGCLAIHPEEETDEEGVIFADRCYVGHHLSLDDGADYTYDYGEEWNFHIKVEKIMKAKGDRYPRTIEMTGEDPIDEDDDD